MSEIDELAEIGGVKPKVVIKDGDEVDAPSHTSSTVYKVKRAWDHYYWQVDNAPFILISSMLIAIMLYAHSTCPVSVAGTFPSCTF